MAKSDGLGKWFKQEWVDVATGKPCGRKSATKSKRKYPACRPKSVYKKMSKSERQSFVRRKRKKGLPKNGKPRRVRARTKK